MWRKKWRLLPDFCPIAISFTISITKFSTLKQTQQPGYKYKMIQIQIQIQIIQIQQPGVLYWGWGERNRVHQYPTGYHHQHHHRKHHIIIISPSTSSYHHQHHHIIGITINIIISSSYHNQHHHIIITTHPFSSPWPWPWRVCGGRCKRSPPSATETSPRRPSWARLMSGWRWWSCWC